MKSWRKLMTISLLVAAFMPAATHTQEAFQAKELLQKDLNAYAGGDLVLSVGEITIAPGASGSRHRHPDPTFV
jgi:quercetin dioxygenase-like cupin family protein